MYSVLVVATAGDEKFMHILSYNVTSLYCGRNINYLVILRTVSIAYVVHSGILRVAVLQHTIIQILSYAYHPRIYFYGTLSAAEVK
jgi:hypothetical protein